jgi:gentisate 1,2-dioxygenase
MTQYERTIELAKESARRAKRGPVVVHTRELKLEHVKGRTRTYVSEPEILGSMVQTMAMFIAEIAPAGKTGKHRHFNEAMIYILEGRGHSVIEGERYEWGEGDVVSIPLYAWHQHFNDDPAVAARYLGVTNIPLLRAMGLNRLEDAEV